MTKNEQYAQATVSGGGQPTPTEQYDREHGQYADPVMPARESLGHGAQVSSVKSSFAFRGK